jgi:hypothetical protein
MIGAGSLSNAQVTNNTGSANPFSLPPIGNPSLVNGSFAPGAGGIFNQSTFWQVSGEILK